MPDPYLTRERLEDFKDKTRFDGCYAQAQAEELREAVSRQNAILAMVRAHAQWLAGVGRLDLTTASGRQLTRAEAETRAAEMVEDTLIDMLDERTGRLLRERD
jgi:hypothetical protein